MSTDRPDNDPLYQSIPIEAEIIEAAPADDPFRRQMPQPPKPKKRSSWLPLLGWGAAILFLFTFVGGVIFMAVIRNVPEVAAISGADTPALKWKPVENKAEIIKQIDGTWQVDTEQQKYFPIRQLLARLESASESGDQETLRELIDWPTRMRRFFAVYRFQPVDTFLRLQFARFEREDASMPADVSDFRIAAIDEVAADEWFVYTYAMQGSWADMPFLFHMRQVDGEWKMVDWCEVPEMRWQAEANGLGAGPEYGDFLGDDQRAFIDDLLEYDVENENGNDEAALEYLADAEAHTGLAQLHDSNLNLIAARYYYRGDYDEALRLVALANDADSVPWLHYVATMAYYAKGDYELAIAAADKYEKSAGFHYDIVGTKAYSLEALDRKEEAAEITLQLLRYRSDYTELVSTAFDLLPAERFGEVIELLQSDEHVEGLISAARNRLFADDMEAFDVIYAHLRTRIPDDTRLIELDADKLHCDGKLPEAAAAYLGLSKRLDGIDDDEAFYAFNEYLSVSLDYLTPLELYQQATDRRKVLDSLTDMIEDYDALIGVDELATILPVHIESDPDDPRNSFYAGVVAMDRHDYQAAAESYANAIETFGEQDNPDNDYFIDNLRYYLKEARYYLGQWRSVYEEDADKQSAFQTLANLMSAEHDWAALEELVSLHGEPDNLWVRYYTARIEERKARQADDSRRLKHVAAMYQLIAADNEADAEISSYLLDLRISELVAHNSDWRTLFLQHDDKESLVDELASRFRRAGDEAALTKFFDLCRLEIPDSDALWEQELEQHWLDGEYEKYIDRAAWPNERLTDRYYGSFSVAERLVIAHLMVGDSEAAWRVASEPEELVRLKLLIRMAEGDDQAVRELLAENEAYHYGLLPPDGRWTSVPGLEAFLRSNAFRLLRQEHPLPIETPGVGFRAVLLYPTKHEWSVEQIEKLLAPLGLDDLAVEKLETQSHSYRLTTNHGRCLLTIGNDPFADGKEWFDHVTAARNDFLPAVDSHQSWLGLEALDSNSVGYANDWNQMISAVLLDATAAWGTDNETSRATTLTTTDEMNQLRGGKRFEQFYHTIATAWLPFGNVNDGDWYLNGNRRWRTELESWNEQSPAQQITVRLNHGSAVEHLPLRILRVEPMRWGEFTLIAELSKDCVLNGYLKKGDVVEVDTGEIIQWNVDK